MGLALSPGLVLGLSLGLGATTVLLWAVATRAAEPPRFRGYEVHPTWKIDPVAVLDRDLRNGSLASALDAVRGRLLAELHMRYGLTEKEIYRGGSPFPLRKDPEAAANVRAIATLGIAYRSAERAEDPERHDLWSNWRRPAWKAAARRVLSKELERLEALSAARDGDR